MEVVVLEDENCADPVLRGKLTFRVELDTLVEVTIDYGYAGAYESMSFPITDLPMLIAGFADMLNEYHNASKGR